jgi:plasmid maintenance system antidote protein VapI
MHTRLTPKEMAEALKIDAAEIVDLIRKGVAVRNPVRKRHTKPQGGSLRNSWTAAQESRFLPLQN